MVGTRARVALGASAVFFGSSFVLPPAVQDGTASEGEESPDDTLQDLTTRDATTTVPAITSTSTSTSTTTTVVMPVGQPSYVVEIEVVSSDEEDSWSEETTSPPPPPTTTTTAPNRVDELIRRLP